MARVCCSQKALTSRVWLGPPTPSPSRPGGRMEAGAARAGTDEGGVGAAGGSGGWARPPLRTPTWRIGSQRRRVCWGQGTSASKVRSSWPPGERPEAVPPHKDCRLTAYSRKQGHRRPLASAAPGCWQDSRRGKRRTEDRCGAQGLVHPLQPPPPLRAAHGWHGPPRDSDDTAGT